ncbi:hypothetical protein [Mesorhizobium sp. SP-1A]|uniref:hypothetical protein n=1 Tax=Mesorhizobium sp. SP-1A TaxID=3077840 RepID=UPI0028F6F616|nr:hypothetical protein [Mesorhizobium sp. SP-1A]
MSNTRVFYSWQSSHGSRRVVEKYVNKALAKLNSPLVEVSEIDGSVLQDFGRYELDHDTKGVSGMPPIMDTIKEKIQICDVFVADMTPIEINDRYYPNPNVMLELGYALHALGHGRIVLVANVSKVDNYDFSKMPFDLKHHRKPIEVDENNFDASKVELLARAMELISPREGVFKEKHVPKPTIKPGLIIDPSKPFAYRVFSDGELPYRFLPKKYIYARFWPEMQTGVAEDHLHLMFEKSNRMLLPNRIGADRSLHLPDGALSALSAQSKDCVAASMFSRWFSNGEVNLAAKLEGRTLDIGLFETAIVGNFELYQAIFSCNPTVEIGIMSTMGIRYSLLGDEEYHKREVVLQSEHIASLPIQINSIDEIEKMMHSFVKKLGVR